jgi:hypothetical protein
MHRRERLSPRSYRNPPLASRTVCKDPRRWQPASAFLTIRIRQESLDCKSSRKDLFHLDTSSRVGALLDRSSRSPFSTRSRFISDCRLVVRLLAPKATHPEKNISNTGIVINLNPALGRSIWAAYCKEGSAMRCHLNNASLFYVTALTSFACSFTDASLTFVH